MNPILLAAVLAAAPVQPPAGLALLRIEHAAARVVVIPEARGAMAVAIRQGRGLPALKLRREGPALVVDGGLAGAGRGGLLDVFDRSRCRTAPADLPVITVRAPMNARIAASGAIFGEAGPSESLDLAAEGCGSWRLGPVRTRLAISTRGSPSVQAAGVSGTLDVRLKGSGDVTVQGGHATVATVTIEGSGDVVHRGTVGRLAADLRGSGTVRIREIYGEVDASVHGTGDVFFSRPAAGHFCGGRQKAC